MRTLVLAAAAVCLGACNDPEPPYTCDLSANGAQRFCVQYAQQERDENLSAKESSCRELGGIWAANLACPTANLVASCQMPADRGGAFWFWYVGATALDLQEASCTTSGGIWTVYPA